MLRVVQYWNKLPVKVVNATSQEVFEAKMGL